MNYYIHIMAWRKIACFLLLLSIGIPGLTKSNKDTLSFIHITDIHHIYNSADYYFEFIQKRLKHFNNDKHTLIKFLETVELTKKADFIAVTGDLIDFYEAETNYDELLGIQIEQFGQLINFTTNTKLYFTLGNHDIASYPKKGFHQNNSAIARIQWMKNIPAFVNGTYYSRIYKVGETTYRLIFLDNSYLSQNFRDRTQCQFVIDKPQLDWLKYQLNQSSEDKEIIFMHIPIPIQEDTNGFVKESYEKYLHSTKTNSFLDVIKNTNSSSLQLIIAGHRHIDLISKFNFNNNFNFIQVMTSAFGHDENNWRLFQLTESEIIIQDTYNVKNNNKTVIELQ